MHLTRARARDAFRVTFKTPTTAAAVQLYVSDVRTRYYLAFETCQTLL